MRIKLIFLAVATLFMTACKTGSNFTSRHYLAGHYKSNHSHVKKPESTITNHDKKKIPAYPELEKDGLQLPDKELIAAKEGKKTIFSEKKHKNLQLAADRMGKKSAELLNNYKKLFAKPAKDKTELRSGKGDDKISQKALIGFACGVGGVAIDIICFVAAVASLSYGILIGMVIGLALGILGIIFGTQGIKDYKTSRNTPTLVFGIVGAATGLGAIILAIYLGLYGALLIAANFI